VDMQTPAAALTLPLNGIGGPEHQPETAALELVRRTIVTPAQLEFDDDSAEEALRLLRVRNELVERIHNIREARARMSIVESVAEELDGRLDRERDLLPHQAKRMRGQRDEQRVQCDRLGEKIIQWQMEIGVFSALLRAHTKG
jgi:hypothetical protein